MNNTNQNMTPMWLELKNSYIDDNFEGLLTYLKVNAKSNESFYQTTLQLLRKRVEALVEELSMQKLYEERKRGDEGQTIFNIRLLGAYLLTESAKDGLSISAFTALVHELCCIVNERFYKDLTAKAMERMRHTRVENYGFGWQDVIEFKQDIFAFKITEQSSFSVPVVEPLLYGGKAGSALLDKDGMLVSCATKNKVKEMKGKGAVSMNTGMGMGLLTAASDKLKQSSEGDIPAMTTFIGDFVNSLAKPESTVKKRARAPYFDGDRVVVKVTAKDADGTIHVETTNDQFEPIQGELVFLRSNIIYYSKRDFTDCIKVGDCLPATVEDINKSLFSIEKTFIEFIVESCKEDCEGQELLAKAIYKVNQSLVWLTAYGIPIYTYASESYQIGSLAYLEVTKYGSDDKYGVINGNIVDSADRIDDFDTHEIQNDTIDDFASRIKPLASAVATKESGKEMPEELLKLLLRQMFGYQKTLLKPSERYRLLCNALAMAEVVGDADSASYLRYEATYLRILMAFVNNEDYKGIVLETDEKYGESKVALLRKSVVLLLGEYGKKDNSPILAKTIEDFEETLPTLARLARLIQTANSLQGIITEAAFNVIRREIIKTLSIETANQTDLEEGNDIYMGIESSTVEFKTSMVYPAGRDMQPNETEQNHNVLKGICAFMNTAVGGTLYLGVNDQGYVRGIENDMKYLKMYEIDTYARYVQDRILQALGNDCMTCIEKIEPQFDNRVLSVKILPHPTRIVTLRDKAYLRVNAESRLMPEKVREEILKRKTSRDESTRAILSMLQFAKDERKCVILHNYASSNSGSVQDRVVEPYDIFPTENLVVCYDVNKLGVRMFSLNRIGYVEILEKQPWKYQQNHVKKFIDDFHMSGETSLHVSLKLDLMARNLLIEEYPAAKDHVVADKKDNDAWYYEADIYKIEGIGRFYIGLANHIEILEGKELKAYAQEYAEKYLKN